MIGLGMWRAWGLCGLELVGLHICSSVWRGRLDVVDDQDLHRGFSAFQPEPELMCEGSFRLRVGVIVRGAGATHCRNPQLQAEVPEAGQVGAVGDRRLHVVNENVREPLHGLAARTDATARMSTVPGDRRRCEREIFP